LTDGSGQPARRTGVGGRAALVLSGGGARGAYQVGVLRHIASQVPDAVFPIYTGVSAGAINAAFLASHTGDLQTAAEQLSKRWCSLTTGRVMRSDVFSLLGNVLRIGLNLTTGGARFAPAVRGLVDTNPLCQFLRPLLDTGGIDENVRTGRLHAVAISATSYRTGQITTFVQGDQGIRMWERVRRRSTVARIGVDHVMASAAIPVFFPARPIDGEYYGDGSIRESHPLAPAVHLGADCILAVSSRSRLSRRQMRTPVIRGYPPAARVIGLMLNSIFLDNLDVDAERLQRVNHLISKVPPAKRWLLAEREVKLLVLRPSRDIGRLAADHEKLLPAALRFLVRGLGTRRSSSGDLVSYLLFESEYLSKLIELGEQDARRQWLRIRRFLDRALGNT
jgi:NTE family protein